MNWRDIQKLAVMFLQLLSVFVSTFVVTKIPISDLDRSGIVIIGLLHILVFYLSDFYYQFHYRDYLSELIEVLKYSVILAFFITLVSFILENTFVISRKEIVLFICWNFLGVYLTNFLIRKYLQKKAFRSNSLKKVLLITTQDCLDPVLESMEESGLWGGHLIGVVLLDGVSQLSPSLFGKINIIDETKMVECVTRMVVDEVFISISSTIYDIKDLVSKFEVMGIDVSVNINAFDFGSIGDKKIGMLANFSVLTFSPNFCKYSHILAKRLLDIIGSIVGLAFCGSAAMILVPLIKRDGGPAIFAQQRVGKNGRVFKFYKFRSMYIDAEDRKEKLLALNQMQGGMFKIDNDPRITPIGRFIRRTSLDELPQFYNVLKGEMSLVGTRPPTLDEYFKYTPEQKRRLSFKPGITGLWQVSGRSQITNFDDVVKLDIAYIDDWTIWSDIKILLKTLRVVWNRDGAR